MQRLVRHFAVHSKSIPTTFGLLQFPWVESSCLVQMTRRFECDLESLIHRATEAPETSSSSNTLYSVSFALEGHSIRASCTKDGWFVGPAGSLLLWTPMDLRPSIAHATLVTPDGSSQLDLSSIANGTSWQECRE